MSESRGKIISDAGVSDPTAPGSQHGHDVRPRPHEFVDASFQSSSQFSGEGVLTIPDVNATAEELTIGLSISRRCTQVHRPNV